MQYRLNIVALDLVIFCQKVNRIETTKKMFLIARIPNKTMKASYKVAYIIAKCKKPYTRAVELILSVAADIGNIVIDECFFF